MARFAVLVSACGLAAMMVLQGCGGGGGSDTTTVKTTSAAPTTTTPAAPGGTTAAPTTTAPTTTSAAPTTTTPAPVKPTTTTTPQVGPHGLRYCEEVDTFLKKTVDDTGATQLSSQCKPSQCPGAQYTKQGQKDPDGKSDKMWGCLNPDNVKHDQMNDAYAKANGFEGACEFKDYGHHVNPSDVGDCAKQLSHHPAVCAPGPTAFWGACYSKQTEGWYCINKDDANIPGLASGDCKAQPVKEATGEWKDYFYDGVCRFPPEVQKKYKCDTVTSYDTNSGSTCGRNVGATADKACFSLKAGDSWQCMEKETPFSDQPCDWTVVGSDTSEFFRGACVFKNNEGYADALDAKNLTKAVPRTVVV